jgi:hypothetical protein
MLSLRYCCRRGIHRAPLASPVAHLSSLDNEKKQDPPPSSFFARNFGKQSCEASPAFKNRWLMAVPAFATHMWYALPSLHCCIALLHCIAALHCCIALHCLSMLCISFPAPTFHCIALHCIAFPIFPLDCLALHCVVHNLLFSTIIYPSTITNYYVFYVRLAASGPLGRGASWATS